MRKAASMPIKFDQRFIPLIKNGVKTVTRRLVEKNKPTPYGHVGQFLYVREMPAPEWTKQISGLGGILWWQAELIMEIKTIRKERLCQVTEADMKAEGFANLGQFKTYWNERHFAPNTRFEDNPAVWVIEFKLLSDQGKWPVSSCKVCGNELTAMEWAFYCGKCNRYLGQREEKYKINWRMES